MSGYDRIDPGFLPYHLFVHGIVEMLNYIYSVLIKVHGVEELDMIV